MKKLEFRKQLEISSFFVVENYFVSGSSLSCFRAHEKEVHSDLNSFSHFHARKKELHPNLFFNLRLRKASKPLREHV